MARDLIVYGTDVPRVQWPGEARVAVSFVVHFEEGAESTPVHPEISVRVAREMIERGYRDVRPLQGGLEAWRQARQPMVAKLREAAAPRPSVPEMH